MKFARQLVVLLAALTIAGCTAKLDGGDLPQWEPKQPFRAEQVYEFSVLFPR